MSNWMEDRTTRGEFPCPWCDEANDAAIALSDAKATPKAGDIALCFNCARPAVYQEIGKPRKPTEAEWAVLNADPAITQSRKTIFMNNRGNVRYDHMGLATMQDGDE